MSRQYTKDHEWIEIDGDSATVGITDYAQDQLGDLVFIELPAAGKVLARGDEAAVVESVKAASEVYSPVSGTVVQANEALVDNPEMVNEDAEGQGWFFKLSLSDFGELASLMDETAYNAFLAELD